MTATVAPLAWDSHHFGRATAALEGVDSELALRAGIDAARSMGVGFLYWLSDDAFVVSEDLLCTAGGRRIVGYRRYERPPRGDAEVDDRIVSIVGQPASGDLLQLALLAGGHSRFRLDTRLPAERFEALYRQWLEGSLEGRLATDVLAVRGPDGTHAFVTYRVRDDVAAIGLIATAPAQQGRGLGQMLLCAVERAALTAGCTRVEVATQTENLPACALYERSGYQIAHQGSYYHFILP